MRSRRVSVSALRIRRPRRVLVGVVALAMAAATLATSTAPAEARKGNKAPVSDITMVQANIYTGLSVERFQADVATVLSLRPDFVTYNEVMFRNDGVMAPEGYDIYRDMTNRFTAETPVAWRSDRWTALDEGSWMISDKRGKPPGRSVELGRRYANWVTLQGVDGRVVSVVSVHVAPLVHGMPDLLRGSVTRLGLLVDELAPRGPVLVGGDFNVHYTSGRYPRDILTADNLTSTYDVMGSYFPTGDHHGSTIDYLFDSDAATLLPDSQYPVELNSDHDAVVAGLSWQTDVPTTTRLVANNPQAGPKLRGAVVATLIEGIDAAEPGSRVALRTSEVSLVGVVQAIRRALSRGVNVRISLAGRGTTRIERRLTGLVARRGGSQSSVRQCGPSCGPVWRAAGVPKGFMLVSGPKGVWNTRYDTNRSLTSLLVQKQSQVTVNTGELALEEGAKLLHLGRS